MRQEIPIEDTLGEWPCQQIVLYRSERLVSALRHVSDDMSRERESGSRSRERECGRIWWLVFRRQMLGLT